MRFAKSGLEHRHRGLIGVQHAASKQRRLHGLGQGSKLYTTHARPSPKARARHAHFSALENTLQAVVRLMVSIFAHQYMSQQPRGGDPLVDDLRRHRRLDQSLAAAAYPFATHMAFDLEDSGRIVELLTDLFANALEHAAAATYLLLRFMRDRMARQMRRQMHAARLVLRRFGA